MAGRNQWHKLPDALAERILALLPISSVLAARCVCRHFHTLLSSPSFPPLWNSSSSPPRDLFFLVFRCCSSSVSSFNPSSDRWRHLPFFSLPSLDPAEFLPLASSGGLVIFRCRSSNSPDLTVCNPLTGVARVLPRNDHVNYVDILGLAADRSTNSYIVLITGTAGRTSSESITEVYDSRTDRWALRCRSSQEFLQSFYEVCAVWYNGNFYCLATLDYHLLVYEMSTHEWKDLEVHLPSEFLRRPSLVVSGGKLLMVGKIMHGFKSHSIRVWELASWDDGSLQWVTLDTMPYYLFKAMHYPYSTFIRCQAHGNLILFTTNKGMESVMYNELEGKWRLLPENKECRCSESEEAGRNNLVGLPYEPSLSASV